MSRVIDVCNQLVPALWFFAEYWRPHGVTPDIPSTVFDLATADSLPDIDDARAWTVANRDRFDPAVVDAFGPLRVARDLCLRGRAGLLLLEGCSFRDPGQGPPASIEEAWSRIHSPERPVFQEVELIRTLRLRAGQVLNGISCAPGGSTLRSTSRVALLVEAGATVRDLRLISQGGTGVVCQGGWGLLERIDVVAALAALRFEGADQFAVRRCKFSSASPDVPVVEVDAASARVSLSGSQLVAGGTALVLGGRYASVMRCRVEQIRRQGESPDPRSLVEVAGDGNAVIGCSFIGSEGPESIVAVRSTARGTVLEKNTYPTSAAESTFSGRLVDDHGSRTTFRDSSRRGFPPVALSTYNYLVDGRFDHWQTGAGGATPPDAQVPSFWHADPPLPAWNSGSPARSFWRVSAPTDGQARWPDVPDPEWTSEVPPDVLYEAASPTHLGQHALAMGVTEGAIAGAFVQTVTLPHVANEFTLSAFVRVRGPGRAYVEVVLDDGLRAFSQDAPPGGWRQLTARLNLVGPPRRGLSPVAVRCVVSGHLAGQTEAVFDRVQLVAGCMVPHFADREWTDVGGGRLPILFPRSGRLEQVTLRGAAGRAMSVVPVDMQLVDDLYVAWRAMDGLSSAGLFAVQLFLNDKPLLDPHASAFAERIEARGAYRIGIISLSRLSQRSLKHGDVLRLMAAATVEELSVAVTGRVERV